MGVRIEGDGFDHLIQQMRDVESGRAFARAAEAMDAHLATGYAETQALLSPHTKTGRTATSGHVESSFTGTEWTGSVEYGDSDAPHATGARWLPTSGKHGADLDYLAPLDRTGEQVGEALNEAMRDALRW